jgi:hypothetical protein
MPHPHAVLKHGEKVEVSRKASMLKESSIIGNRLKAGRWTLGYSGGC